jgi:hemerythrin-like metal-binding protein
MPFSAFVKRFVLHKEGVSLPDADSSSAVNQTPSGDKLAPWKCGIPKLDEPNEALIKAIRQYQATCKTGAGPSATEEVLTFLESHVESHLPLEEVYLERIHFPGLAEHRQGHRLFQHQIHAIRNRVANGEVSIGLELSQVLYAWMREHILKEDAAWRTFAKARRSQVTNP